MPALPLDEAGRYVAGAYVVFLALVLVYVAIMAAKVQRIQRQLAELAEQAEGSGRRWLRSWRSASRTRPRRSSCASGSPSPRAAPTGVLRELRESAEVHEAATISTCNRTELYLFAPDPVGAETLALGHPRPRGRDPADRARRPPLLAQRRRRRASTSSG